MLFWAVKGTFKKITKGKEDLKLDSLLCARPINQS